MRNVLGRIRASDAKRVRELLNNGPSARGRQEKGRRLGMVAEQFAGKRTRLLLAGKP